MLIGGLSPTGRPAQQLMELLWAQEGQEWPVRGAIYTFTSRLLHLGYVQRYADGLEVTLTDEGKVVAQALSETAEGQLHRAQVEGQ